MPKPPCGGADRLTRYFGCARPMLGVSCPKVFRGFKGGFFQKAPLNASLLWHFLFADKGYCPLSIFFCAGAPGKPNGFGLPGALSKEKEELWNLITEWKKVLSVRAGAYGMPLTVFGTNIRCMHPTDSESCTAGAPTAGGASAVQPRLTAHCGNFTLTVFGGIITNPPAADRAGVQIAPDVKASGLGRSCRKQLP